MRLLLYYFAQILLAYFVLKYFFVPTSQVFEDIKKTIFVLIVCLTVDRRQLLKYKENTDFVRRTSVNSHLMRFSTSAAVNVSLRWKD